MGTENEAVNNDVPSYASQIETGQENNGGTNEPPNQGGNPAWDDLLGVVPKEFHTQLLPHLQKWDTGVQQRFQQVHSQYEPYKEFLDGKIDPEDLRQGLGVIQAIKDDPRSVYMALAQNFDFNETVQDEEQGKTEVTTEEENNLPPHIAKELQELRGYVETLGQYLVKQREDATEQEEYDNLEREFSALRKEHGEFDERFVLALMQNGATAQDAVKEWGTLVDGIRSQNNRPKIPSIMRPGSSVPESGGIDPRRLNPGQTKDLVADMLRASMQQT